MHLLGLVRPVGIEWFKPHWDNETEYVHVEKVKTFVITKASRKWLNERWQVKKRQK